MRRRANSAKLIMPLPSKSAMDARRVMMRSGTPRLSINGSAVLNVARSIAPAAVSSMVRNARRSSAKRVATFSLIFLNQNLRRRNG